MKKNLIVILLLLCLPYVCAYQYYADISIDVDEAGIVSINGDTNYPGLITQDSDAYTSKKQSYWTINITQEGVFSGYVYSLNLPRYSSVNYIKSSGSFRIEGDSGNMIIKGFGENKTFSVVAQYRVQKKPSSVLFVLVIISLIAIFLFAILFFLKYKKIKLFSRTKKDLAVEDVRGYDPKGLTSRQKKIMHILVENKKPMTQAQIQTELKIPKASVSRNIKSLELKGLIEKESAGISNLIRIKK
jgi:uncharacterized membrane protein